MPDDMILANLGYGVNQFEAEKGIRGLIVLEDNLGVKYLTIVRNGANFTGSGNHAGLKYDGKVFGELRNNENRKKIS